MNPQDQPQPPSLPQPVQGPQVYTSQPMTGEGSSSSVNGSNTPGKGSRKPLYTIIAVCAVVVAAVIVTVVILADGTPNKKAADNTPATTQQSTGPAPANSLTLQQNVDAINQNLSSLNNSADFAPTALSDSSLSGGN